MTEVEEKNAKETDKVESALQRAIHITKLLIIWAARSFLYSGCTFCVFLVFHFVYGKASSNELVEVGALCTDKNGTAGYSQSDQSAELRGTHDYLWHFL